MISSLCWGLCPLQEVLKHSKHPVHGLYLWVLLPYVLGEIWFCFYTNFACSESFGKWQSNKVFCRSFPSTMNSTVRHLVSMSPFFFPVTTVFIVSLLSTPFLYPSLLFFRPPKHSCQGCWSCRMDTLFAWTLSWPCQPSLEPLTTAPPKPRPSPLWRAWPWGCSTVLGWTPQQSCPSTPARRCFRAWESGQSRGTRRKHLILNESSEYTPN